jgi:protein-disulfide isomerase
MHDRLFTDQATLSEAVFEKQAKALGLDLARFKKDAASDATAARVAEDMAAASAVGASGTPTLFVNCRKLVGAQPFEAFKALIDDELRKAEAAQGKGEKIDGGWYDRACAANISAVPRVEARADDPAIGPKDARVTVIEFSDFQCPFCSQAVPVVKELEKTYGKELRITWKHLPLSFHQNAMPAALAAEAAREQGKFWEMHDRLFANQAALTDITFEKQARELGLDVTRFKASLASPETRKRVEADAALASAAGVTGTPTFLVNGEQVVGSGALRDAVKRQLEKAKSARN